MGGRNLGNGAGGTKAVRQRSFVPLFGKSKHAVTCSPLRRRARVPIWKFATPAENIGPAKFPHDGNDARDPFSLSRIQKRKKRLRRDTRSTIGLVVSYPLFPKKKHNIDVCDLFTHARKYICYYVEKYIFFYVWLHAIYVYIYICICKPNSMTHVLRSR